MKSYWSVLALMITFISSAMLACEQWFDPNKVATHDTPHEITPLVVHGRSALACTTWKSPISIDLFDVSSIDSLPGLKILGSFKTAHDDPTNYLCAIKKTNYLAHATSSRLLYRSIDDLNVITSACDVSSLRGLWHSTKCNALIALTAKRLEQISPECKTIFTSVPLSQGVWRTGCLVKDTHQIAAASSTGTLSLFDSRSFLDTRAVVQNNEDYIINRACALKGKTALIVAATSRSPSYQAQLFYLDLRNAKLVPFMSFNADQEVIDLCFLPTCQQIAVALTTWDTQPDDLALIDSNQLALTATHKSTARLHAVAALKKIKSMAVSTAQGLHIMQEPSLKDELTDTWAPAKN